MSEFVVIAKIVPSDSEEAKKAERPFADLHDLDYFVANESKDNLAKLVEKNKTFKFTIQLSVR